MNNKFRLTTGLVLFAGIAAAAHAQALKYNPSVYIQPEAGYFDPDNRFGTHATGPEGGLKFGKAINQYFDVQVGGSYARADSNGVRVQQTTAGITGIGYLPTYFGVRPFLSVGIGAENDRRNIPNFENSRTSPYAAAGVGVQYRISDQWATDVEYKRMFGFQRSDVYGFKRNENNYVNVGLTYYFDKTPAPAPRVEPPLPPPPVAQITPPPPPPPPAPRFEKQTLSATKMFDFNSSVLRRPLPKLDEIASVLQANPQVGNVQITGYTDRIGSPAYNLKLSQRRADSVKSYLVSKGIDGSRMTAVGKGEADPVVQCTDKNRAALIRCLEPNRRVEVEDVTIERRVQ